MILKQKFTTFIFLKIFFLFFSSLIINAQTTYHDFGFQKKFDIVVYDTSNNILQRAWEGGLNSVQFGNIDLNLDGIEDLVIFDKCGNRILPYLNSGQAGTNSFTYAPFYELKFPKTHDWVIFKDYNNDGKADIFTYSYGGIAIYKNTSTLSSGLSFELMTPMLLSYQYNGYVNLFVTTVDYPAIEDIDGDGDLDILCFFGLGTFLEHHLNQSIEKYGVPDSLDFKRVNQCWGNFAESENNNKIKLNVPCPWKCYDAVKDTDNSKAPKHTGSTMLSIDLNNDGVYDLLLGDVDFSNIIALYNGGTKDSSNITALDTAFPSYNKPIDLFSFPSTAYIDMDNDGIKDLIVSPFDPNPLLNESFKSVWFYKNIGSNTCPVFNLLTEGLFQEDMIETGTGAYPVLYDIDGDGLIDLFVANYGYRDSTYWDEWGFIHSTFISKISYFKNTGNMHNPEFTLVTNDFAELSSLKTTALYPAFGDMDNDGDIDMIIGCEGGGFKFYKNIADAGNEPLMIAEHLPSLDTVIIGKFSTPQLIDLDQDGLIDLVSGEKNGNLNFFKNTGNLQNPVFEKITDSLGKVNVTDYNLSYSGYSTPCFFKDTLGNFKLFCGSEQGYILYYDNINNNINGNFNLRESMLNYYDEGARTGVAVADLDNDGYMDMIIGNLAGGVSYYKGDTPSQTHITEISNIISDKIILYPNPTNNNITIDITSINLNSDYSIEIYNSTGLLINKIDNYKTQNKITLNISNLANGIYFCRIIDNSLYKVKTIKFVVKH